MATRVVGPDGRVVEFPAGTPREVMERAMREHYGTAEQPAEGGFGQFAARELGLGARAMLEGIGSTLGIVTDPIAYGVGKVANTHIATAREGFSSLADTLGFPAPQTPSERVGADITGALAGGGGFIGAGRTLATRAPGIAQRVGETLAAQPATQLAAIASGAGASGAVRESGGGTGAQTAAALAGGLGIPALRAAVPSAVRGLARGGEAGRQAMEQGIADFRSVGAQPSVGQATGNRRTQGLESLLAGAPTSANRVAAFAEAQADDIGRGLQQRADRFMPNASAERAGRAIERGTEQFAGDVRATRDTLYTQADKLIPSGTVIPLTNTKGALESLIQVPAGAPGTGAALVNQEIRGIAQRVFEDLAQSKGRSPFSGAGVQLEPGMAFETVRAIRTRIGEQLTAFSLAPDRPTAQYRHLYTALSQDLEEAARRQGPQAEAAMRRANTYTRASAERLEQVERVVDKHGGPEKIYNAVMSGTRDGGTTLRAVLQSLPRDGQRAVTAATIKRMGLATPGQQGAAGDAFSAQTFLTNWNRVSPEAKKVLFDRHGPQFSRDMDQIARVAERIRTGSQVFANPSGTANRAAAIGYYGSIAGATGAAALGAGVAPLGVLILGGLSANTAARLMTNPNLVAWLAKTTRMPIQALPQQIPVLKHMAQQDPVAAEVLEELESQQPVEQQGYR